jgi:Peroxisomal biogenesis factor 11 (PEX11)
MSVQPGRCDTSAAASASASAMTRASTSAGVHSDDSNAPLGHPSSASSPTATHSPSPSLFPLVSSSALSSSSVAAVAPPASLSSRSPFAHDMQRNAGRRVLKFLASTAGRDRVYRAAQYSAKLLRWVYAVATNFVGFSVCLYSLLCCTSLSAWFNLTCFT